MMSNSIERNVAADPPRSDAELDLELGPAALRDMLQGSKRCQPLPEPPATTAVPAAALPVPPMSPHAPPRGAHARVLLHFGLPACALLAFALLIAGPVQRALTASPVARRAAARISVGTIAVQQPASVASTDPPVKFANPFDRAEVFEFPSGTTPEEARAQVAELLLQRAQERRLDYQHHRRMARQHATASTTALPKPPG